MRAPNRALAAGACLVLLGLAGCSDDLSVAMPEAKDRQEITAQLARAAQAQGTCYGWVLDGGAGNSTSQGSNLGENVAVESDPERCPKWVRVRASVWYAPESSESSDSASVWVDTYPATTAGATIVSGLERLGLNEEAFIDDPALAISRAVLALPLLTAEAGVVDPAPTPSARPSAPPPTLEKAGNDFWRDRWVYLVVGLTLLAFAGLFVFIGVRQGAGQARRRKVGRPARSELRGPTQDAHKPDQR